MHHLQNTSPDTIDCVISFARQPNRLIDYLSDFDACTKTAATDDGAKFIAKMMEHEIEDDVVLQPEIHLFDVTVAVDSAPNPIIRGLLETTPTLTLCLIKLNCGVLPVFVDAFFCSRNTAFVMIKNLKHNLDQQHRSYHIEYHGIPHNEMLYSLHDEVTR